MQKKRVRRSLQWVGMLCILSSCTLFDAKPGYEEGVPSVSLDSFVEIKESPILDEYGYQVSGDVIQEKRVRRNESLYLILSGLDVTAQEIDEVVQKSKGKFRTNRIQPGQRYITYVDDESQALNRLILHNDLLNYVVFDFEGDIEVKKGKKEITTRISETSGVITSSLYEALLENNQDPLLGNRLSEIFGWQIDFFRVYKDDSFKVIYEQQLVDGRPYGVGKILAAEFVHKNESYDAFFYESNDRAGYFNSEGKGVQKALLKAPFTYSQRVSSNFSHSRFHPVLKRRMPHYGVDYAAPLGTPVIAVGDGTIIESRYRGPNGNIVKIKHNSTYTTAYLHLNGFGPGIKSGVKVKQGQVIGYVGRTGRVTGVHLDYRVYKNDQPVNPLTLELPPSKAIEESEMGKFDLTIEKYKFQLNQIGKPMLASSDFTY
ncbi:MAG: hypothetical protein ED557_13255 [Balneola sp.]|nr:MAG: hypothetical protein ED557_13255 [Balneola sp.]